MLGEIYCGRQGGAPLAEYEQEWARIEIRDTRMFVLLTVEFLVFLPALGIVARMTSKFLPSEWLDYEPGFLMGVFALVFIFTMIRRFRYPCPRCGKNFCGTLYGYGHYRTCAHCGLSRPRRVSITE